MFIHGDDVTLVNLFNPSKLHIFVTEKMIKNAIKLCQRFILHETNKILKTNFITSWKVIKMAQNFVKGSFSIKSTKIMVRNSDGILASSPPWIWFVLVVRKECGNFLPYLMETWVSERGKFHQLSFKILLLC